MLHHAADSSIPEIVSALLKLDIAVNHQDVRGDTALHVAAKSQNSNSAIINILIDGGADIHTRNFAGEAYGIHRIPHDATALHLAAYVGKVEIVRALLEHASRVTNERRLSIASEKACGSPERYEMLKGVATAGRFIDWRSDECGRTPLMCAVESGNVPTVKYLLEMGAAVNARGGRGSWGFCALDLAPAAQRTYSFDNNGGDKQPEKVEKSEMFKLLESYGAEYFEW